MKVCSVCLKCYDDSIAKCSVDGSHKPLSQVRKGNCLNIEGYRLESQIESGSPVGLFQATHLASKKSVVIGFIPVNGSVSKFESELDALSALSHPGLQQVLEFVEGEKDEYCVVLEDITGKGLAELEFPIPEEKAIRIVRRVAEALAVIHEAGLIHGAVNPSNIYLSDDEEHVVLGGYDFGGLIRKSAKTSNRDDRLLYFSPEHFSGDEVNFKTDIYSLGAVFFELLLGRTTVQEPSQESVSNFVFDKLDVWHLDVELRALIAHILKQAFQRRIDLRPSSTLNLIRQIRHVEQVAKRMREKANEPMASAIEPVRDEHSVETRSFESKEDIARTHRMVLPPDINPPPVNLLDSTNYDDSQPVVGKATDDDASQSKNLSTYSLPDDRQIEFSDSEQSGFVEVPIGSGMLSDQGHKASSFGFRLGDRAKAAVYVGGVLASAVFGSMVTASFFEWGSSATSRRENGPIATPTVAMNNVGEDKSKVFISTQDEAAIENKDSIRNESAQGVFQLIPSETRRQKNVIQRKSKPRKAKKIRPRRKQKRRVKNNDVQSAQKNGQTRPRVVKNVVIYY